MRRLHPIEKVLFLDIETVPLHRNYKELSDKMKYLWDKKVKHLKKEEDQTSEDIYNRAGIYAEFGKIICITTAFYRNNKLRVKSFYGDDEEILLKEFADLLNNHFSTNNFCLCAHNGKEFDFPYIARRMLINQIELPILLDLAGLKPWEIAHIDTMELWKFGDYKNYTSLELLASLFNIPTPKDDIDGSQVADVYYKENDLERIKIYCEKDVITIVQLFMKYNRKELIDEQYIEYSIG